MNMDIRSDHAVWLSVRFCLTFLFAARRAAGDDLVSGLLLGGVVGANLDHLDHRPDDSRRFGALNAPSDEHRRPVNSKSLSDSLNVPRETARAKIVALINSGVFHRVGHGVILPSATFESPPFREMSAACIEALEDLVEGLKLFEACGVKRDHGLAQPVWPMAGAVLRLGASRVMRGIAFARALAPNLDPTDAVTLLAVAHLTGIRQRPVAGLLDARCSTSQGPVRGSTVASFLNMPDATVRRRLDALVENARLSRSAHRYDLLLTGEARRPWEEFQQRTVTATAQFVWRLRQCGLIGPQQVER